MQAVERVMSELHALGRVDPTVFFLITPDPNAIAWMQTHNFLNPQTRIPVIFNSQVIKSSAHDQYMVRREIADQVYSRDLFNDQLPLKTDQFFVGRANIVAGVFSALKQSQNRGLFGLRKTGKTSILFKIRRLAERDGMRVIYLDCKDPAIRNLHWDTLLERIIQNILLNGKKDDANKHISDRVKDALRVRSGPKHTCIIFDEIEYISPVAKSDTHWHKEFIDFWQTLLTAQNELRTVSFLIAGVNPTVVELDRVENIQNPLFSIVSSEYVTGLTQREVETLLNYIGSWMGLKFEHEAYQYIYDRYGGHPLLTRMACSHIHIYLTQRHQNRPVMIRRNLLIHTEQNREDDISQYSRHVVSELGDFYPVEYEMLEMLAAGNTADFIELASGSDYTRHLKGYGLVENAGSANPTIRIPLVTNFINRERVTRLSTRMGPQIVQQNHRPYWLRDRIARIIVDLRNMERAAKSKGLPELHGRNGFPEAERFNAIEVCADEASYITFINIVNRCFVESIEQHGVEIKRKDYFWKDVKLGYPEFWKALLRTKLYRHNEMHLILKINVEEQLKEIMKEDFLNSTPESTGCPFFALQQMVLDGLFVSLQRELEKLT